MHIKDITDLLKQKNNYIVFNNSLMHLENDLFYCLIV